MKVGYLVCFLCMMLSLVLFVYINPPFKYVYPRPAGMYSVGNQLIHVIGEDGENNAFNINIFYPSNDTKHETYLYRSAYVEAIKNRLADTTYMPYFIWNILISKVYAYTKQDAEILQSVEKFPLVITLPGIGGIDFDIMMPIELASHGYIVCAIEPPSDTLVTLFPNNKPIFLDVALQQAIMLNDRDAIYRYRDNAHVRWIDYINQTISFLEKFNNNTSSIFYKRLNVDNIGLLGTSHGGAVVVDYCQKYTRCKAGIDMDGWTKSYNSTRVVKVPFLLMIGQRGGIIDISQVHEFMQNNPQSDFNASIIKGAYHNSFGDAVLMKLPWSFFGGNYLDNPEKIRQEINNCIITFLNQYVAH